jgi:hypothetical protein
LNDDIFLDNNNSADYKLDFLEQKKKEGIHFCNKIFVNNNILFSKDKLLTYLNDYEVHVLKRDPFDTFISRMYQDYNDWALSNIFDKESNRLLGMSDSQISDEMLHQNYFVVESAKVDEWLSVYMRFVKLSSWLQDNGTSEYTTIHYEDIQKEYLNNYGVPFPKPLNFDYEELCINYDEIKEEFYNKLERK